VSGRRRRTYRLTDPGRRVLSTERAAWEEFSAAVTRVLKGPTWTTN
jgi:PadR family transcriptional regulator, regulatory protein PadR